MTMKPTVAHRMPTIPCKVILLFGMLFPVTSFATRIDCEKTISPTEKAICKDSNLEMDDRLLDQKYKARLGSVAKNEVGKVVERQRDWMNERETKCGADVKCLLALYDSRLKELDIGESAETLAKSGNKMLCVGDGKSARHYVSLTVSGGDNQGFTVFSVGKAGGTCTVSAYRKEKLGFILRDSKWELMPDGKTSVELHRYGDTIETVSMTRSEGEVLLQFAEPTDSSLLCNKLKLPKAITVIRADNACKINE